MGNFTMIVSMQGDSALLDIHGTSPIPWLSMMFSQVCNGMQGGWVWQASLGLLELDLL